MSQGRVHPRETPLPYGAAMRLTEHERERLLITLAADVAERRRGRGLNRCGSSRAYRARYPWSRWPGTHLTHAEYFRAHGPGAFLATGGYPPIPLPEPEQVTGEAGDLLLAHYLLGHNIGGNTSRAVRRAVYFRIKRTGHDPR